MYYIYSKEDNDFIYEVERKNDAIHEIDSFVLDIVYNDETIDMSNEEEYVETIDKLYDMFYVVDEKGNNVKI